VIATCGGDGPRTVEAPLSLEGKAIDSTWIDTRGADLGFLDDLNPEQREAATYTGGPLLILAGAGSGKTRCLTYRFAYLVRRFGLDPRDILALTFTNKAAREMRGRIERLLGPSSPSLPAHGEGALWISTFHSACARLLRRYGERVGLGRNFTIYDEADQVALMKEVMEEFGWDAGRWPPRGLLALVSRAKDELLSPTAFAERAEDFRQERAARAYARYQELLEERNAVDFDDLIFKTVVLLRENPDVLAVLRRRFRHVLIDEYQDTNHAQYVFADLLAAEHRNLCVVGDDDQSIYRWRGADIRNVLEFETDYPDARVIRLEQNYRSTKTILRAANAVISYNLRRKGKELWTENEAGDPVIYYRAADEREEAAFVAGEIAGGHDRRGLPYGAFAVLYRTHAQSRSFEEVFVRRGIPYRVVGGVRFYDRKEVKDVLAYLRVVHNPFDEVSLERALGVPRRGLGPALMGRLRELGREMAGASDSPGRAGGLYRALKAVAAGERQVPGLGPKLVGEIARFVALVDGLAARAGTMSVTDMVREVAEESGIIETLRAEGTSEAQARIENIQELASVAAEHVRTTGDASLASFLESTALLTDIDTMEEGNEAVLLMTVHNAKGLEFPVVFLVGLEQGLFPHFRSLEEDAGGLALPAEAGEGLEEERRLCYVAMTRAERRLYVTHARRRTLYGFTREQAPSVFLREMPKDALFVASPTAEPDVVGERTAAERAGARTAGAATGGRAASGRSGREVSGPRILPGDKVTHPEWGEGTVVGLDRGGLGPGGGGRLYLKVVFDGEGIKTVAPAEVRRREG